MLEAFNLSGRWAVVTGGARGIGRETSLLLAEAGARVVVVDVDERALDWVNADATGALTSAALDITDSAAVRDLSLRLVQERGPLDILVNNAGICINVDAVEMSDDAWDRVLAVNLRATFLCSREFGRSMLEAVRGTVVNIASMSGSIVNWPQPQAAYNASKAAVIQLTRSLASEWASSGVRVNCVSPGYIGTDMTKQGFSRPGWGETWLSRTPLNRMGEPRDVAYAVLFLASDAAAFATGTNLVVDGGYSIW